MMKKNSYFYFGALAATALLAACATDDGLTDGNYDEQRGVVKTEFTISFPAKAVGGTRMTTATVQGQATPVFRGISSIELYPFAKKVNEISATETDIPTPISLKGATSSTISAVTLLDAASNTDANLIASSSNLFADNNAHLYQDVEIEIGTKAFMFYGVASASTNGTRFTDGDLTKTVGAGGKLSDITFNPVQIHSTGTVGTNGTSIATYLTNIANASDNASHKWSASDNVILRTLYQNFITIQAGSWTSVKAAVQRLYLSLYNKTFADATDNAVKDAILAAITADNYVSYSGSNGILTFTDNAYGNYPNDDLHLPDGAAYVKWDGSASAFQAINFPEYEGTVLASGTSLDGYYTKSGNVYTACAPSGTADGATIYYKKITDNTGLNIADLNKYVYPASLYYRAFSDIKTANESMLKYYQTGNDHQTTWANIITQYGDDNNDEVKFSTRSIAIVNQVEYAVARLDATVTTTSDNLNDAVGTTIALTHLSTTDNSSTVNNFPVTGILIGNQRAVDYQFHPVTTSSPTLYTIYDKTIDSDKVYLRNTTPGTLDVDDKIHTLVLETPEVPATSPTSDQIANGKVKIAVEFKNNSGDLFVGKGGNIIYPDTKFYLVGEFDPTKTSDQTSNPSNLRQVFKQDYTTTANLVIGSLSNAYNTLPDLRAPQLELGLSVNLSWQDGITQTINIE